MYTRQTQIPGITPQVPTVITPLIPQVPRTTVTIPQLPLPIITQIPRTTIMTPQVPIPKISTVMTSQVTTPIVPQIPRTTVIPPKIPTVMTSQGPTPIVPQIPRTTVITPQVPTPIVPQILRTTVMTSQGPTPIVPQIPKTTVITSQGPTPIVPQISRTTVMTSQGPTPIVPQIPRTTVMTPQIPTPIVPEIPRTTVMTPQIPNAIVPEIPRTTITQLTNTLGTKVPQVPVIPVTVATKPVVTPVMVTTPRIPTIPPTGIQMSQPMTLQSPIPGLPKPIKISPEKILQIQSPRREKKDIPLTVKTPPREILIPTLSPEKIENEVPNLDSPTEMFVNIIISEQDADIMDEKDYLGYIKYLFNDQSKYNIFSRLYPNNTCPNVIFRMETETSPFPSIIPNERTFIDCIRAKEQLGGSVAIRFSYKNHGNILWFDTLNKIINRYDPQVSGEEYSQSIMDDTIRTYLADKFPEYSYLGNTLETWQCVQGIRGEGRNYKADYYCQDYSLLYAIKRIQGLSHEEAAFSLVARGEDVLIDLAELLRALAYKIRAELGKEVPERFRNWNPEA